MTSPNLDRVKTLLVDALNASLRDNSVAGLLRRYPNDPTCDWDMVRIEDRRGEDAAIIDADRLATTILTGLTAIVLDREAVRAALNRAFGMDVRIKSSEIDGMVDRLIASLSGGQSS